MIGISSCRIPVKSFCHRTSSHVIKLNESSIYKIIQLSYSLKTLYNSHFFAATPLKNNMTNIKEIMTPPALNLPMDHVVERFLDHSLPVKDFNLEKDEMNFDLPGMGFIDRLRSQEPEARSQEFLEKNGMVHRRINLKKL
jgi:hypothetical protein